MEEFEKLGDPQADLFEPDAAEPASGRWARLRNRKPCRAGSSGERNLLRK